ncbi:MAG TPA: outer membrane beta-barrel protein [Steroidobacteraceae bacterium]
MAAAMLGSGVAAHSEEVEEPNTFEITPFLGFMAGGGFEDPATGADRDVEDDTSFGIFLNLIADVPERQYELLYAKQSSVVEGAAPMDLDVQYLQIGGTIAYPQSRYVAPYFGATIGAARFTPDLAGLDDETKLSFSVGGGIRFPITDHFGIRLDLRAFITVLEDDTKIFCVSDPPSAECSIRPKGDTFVQYTGSLGVSFGF